MSHKIHVLCNVFKFHILRTDVILRVGICVPQSCTPSEVRKFSEQALLENFNLKLEASYDQEILCSTRNRNLGYVNRGVEVFAM